MSSFQANHYLDAVYLNDLNGTRTDDPKIQAALDRMVDVACLGVSIAKIQVEMTSHRRSPANLWELGYVFGCLDAHKILLWGVKEFCRSFFHCGLMSYYGNADAARTGLMNIGIAITSNDPEFERGSNKGRSDALKMISERSVPSGLMKFLNSQS
ncbi:hypothetical protein [uncultured Paracoccus sp.]|uniref:hypothetical protein n=1 Tax=uncultured Paracoccus sp. TaxID=189685 RepID=UPI00261950CB|nr:hypothetical protein [uncultured Paracoccus sp.]